MIFDGFRQGSTAEEGTFRRKNGLSGLTSGGMELDSGEAKNNKKNFRRRKVELRRIRLLSNGKSIDPLVLSDDNVSSKKKRSLAEREIKLIENTTVARLQEKDVGDSGEVTSLPYGMISVIGRRREMEDAVAAELGFLKKGGKSYNFFGVYDGHGGWRVAQACREMLHKLLVKSVEEDNIGEEIAWERVMAAGFKKMDEEVNKNGAAVATTGSTAVVAVIGEEVVVVANCGDSRAVLSRGGVAVQLSDDHKPDRPDELERIEGCGGKVINWNGHRVLGVLATSRSIGDQYLKPFVITDPEVKIINRTKSDEFLVLASDGLWDVVSNELACQVARRCLRAKQHGSHFAEAATVLAELAMARGSHDNITVVVVDLNNAVV